MIDVVGFLLLGLLVVAVVQLVSPWLRREAQKRGRLHAPRPARSGGHDWDKRRDQLYRQVKGLGGPEENRDKILAFLEAHRGVEAYVEPKTVMHPLSVLLVDAEGEAKRFELREDALLRELAKTRGLPVFDATRVGYPERMRRGRDGSAGSRDADA
jgi:hypothetical protein